MTKWLNRLLEKWKEKARSDFCQFYFDFHDREVGLEMDLGAKSRCLLVDVCPSLDQQSSI